MVPLRNCTVEEADEEASGKFLYPCFLVNIADILRMG
jgi:hypothetical protein